MGEHPVESDDETESSETTPCAHPREWGKCGATSLRNPSGVVEMLRLPRPANPVRVKTALNCVCVCVCL